MSRTFIHIDLDAFFCAVEELRNPRLRGARFAVGGASSHRGVVASCSYPARRLGVRSAMPMATAQRLCPDLIVVPARHDHYRPISQQVMALLRSYTPLVEPISIDEAFLDVSADLRSNEALARSIQQAVFDKTGLPASLGVATNKLVAKIATDVGKASRTLEEYPRSIQIVPAGEERRFLAPLPVGALWGVGPQTAKRLQDFDVETIGDLTRLDEATLVHEFGKSGRDLYLRSRGIDDREVVLEREAKSISQENTFSQDVTDGKRLRSLIQKQSHEVARRLKAKEKRAVTVRLKLRWHDFETITRQRSVDRSIQEAEEIARIAIDLLEQNWSAPRRVRLVGVGVTNFRPAVRQMSIFDLADSYSLDEGRERRLQAAIEELRERFGKDAVRRGAHLDGK